MARLYRWYAEGRSRNISATFPARARRGSLLMMAARKGREVVL